MSFIFPVWKIEREYEAVFSASFLVFSKLSVYITLNNVRKIFWNVLRIFILNFSRSFKNNERVVKDNAWQNT